MKLIDILARELKSWPEECEAIEQDRHGSCLYKVDGPALAAYVGNMAEDADTAKVTRAQWQVAVDALKSAEDAGAEWNGEGLPPVGTVCGLWFKGCDQGTVTVLFIGNETGVFKSHSFDHEQHGDLSDYSFYAVGDQDGKDYQARKDAILKMAKIAGGAYSPRDAIVERLYDAGYRKQVTND